MELIYGIDCSDELDRSFYRNSIPQIVKTIRMKSARDVSSMTFLLILVTCSCLLVDVKRTGVTECAGKRAFLGL